MSRKAQLCSMRPEAPECSFIAQRHGDQLESASGQPDWVHDVRIKAEIVAAPAVSYLFESGGSRQVKIPILLWRAEKDRQAPDLWNIAVVRSELPTPPQERVVPGADHFVFLAPCNATLAKTVPVICEDPPGVDRLAFHKEFNRTVVAFFREMLH